MRIARRVIADELELDGASLNDDASLRRDYGLDSVAAVNIIFAIESLLQISLEPSDLVQVDSINDLRQMICKLAP
jgi:acyl carrier protein